MQLNAYLEHTDLRPDISGTDVDRMVKESIEHRFAGVCLPPFWIKRASREVAGAEVRLVTVVGFPMGYQMTEVKMTELQYAIRNGAHELDMVMNISAFKEGMPWAKIEIAKCAKLVHDHECILKVIIETAYLSSQEIIAAGKMVSDAGADYVKTSTGFASKGAEVENIINLRHALPESVGIKASGGIRTYDDALSMVKAGADRIGTSRALDIIAGSG